MASLTNTYQDRTVSIGRVFSRGFGTIAANPSTMFGTALLLGSLPRVAFSYVGQMAQWERAGPAAAIAGAIVSFAVTFALALLVQGALVGASLAFAEGRKAGIGKSARAALSMVLPLLGLALLLLMGVGLGWLLLIVPGILLFVMWSVAAPALVAERIGPVAALRRSRALTEGARWNVFAVELVTGIFYLLASSIVGIVLFMAYGVGGLAAMGQAGAAGGHLPIAWLLISLLTNTVVTTVWAAIQTALYVELRDWKDGPAADQLVEIFI